MAKRAARPSGSDRNTNCAARGRGDVSTKRKAGRTSERRRELEDIRMGGGGWEQNKYSDKKEELPVES